jgi:hypothetical protein
MDGIDEYTFCCCREGRQIMSFLEAGFYFRVASNGLVHCSDPFLLLFPSLRVLIYKAHGRFNIANRNKEKR